MRLTRFGTVAATIVTSLPLVPLLPLVAPASAAVPAAAAARPGVGGGAAPRVSTSAGRRVVASSAARRGKTAPVSRARRGASAAPRMSMFVSRVTASDRAVTDRAGYVWDRLPASFGTRAVSRLPVGDVRGTADDALYRVRAVQAKGYIRSVPAPATYTVSLHFAEAPGVAPGQRVFDVVAEGRTVARGVDVARSAGTGAAYALRIPVAVRDGVLDVQFVPRVGEPMISAVEVSGQVPAGSVVPTHALRLAEDNAFTQRVEKAPLDPDSAAIAARIRAQVVDHWNGVAAVNAYRYNVAYHVAAPGTKRVTVGFDNCQRKPGVPAGLFDGPKHFVDVPVPADAVPAQGTDAEMTIYDPATDRMWDFWQMRRKPGTKAWQACWGGRMDRVSQQRQLAFPGYFGASASGLSMAAGMVSLADMRRGRIDHAMQIAVMDAATWSKVSWPAVRSDGISADPHAIREGQKMRLDPSVDVDSLGLTPFGRMVAKAAQEYGFVVVDKGGAVAVQTEFGVRDTIAGRNAWDWYLGGPDYTALANFPWDRMQVLAVDYGKKL